MLFRSSAGFSGFDSVDGNGVFNWAGTDYTSRWTTRTTHGEWITNNTDPDLSTLAEWNLTDTYAATTGIPSVSGNYVYTAGGEQLFDVTLTDERPVSYQLDFGQDFDTAPYFASGNVFWHTPYYLRATAQEYWPDHWDSGPIPDGTQPGDSGSITDTAYSYSFPVVVYESEGDSVNETVTSELTGAVSHSGNFTDAVSTLGDLSWTSDASGWAKVFPAWTSFGLPDQNWPRWVRDWILGGEGRLSGTGVSYYDMTGASSYPADLSIQPCPESTFQFWRNWFASLGIHGWSGWAWEGYKFVLSKTQLRSVPGTGYAKVKLQINRVSGVRTIDSAEDLGSSTFTTSALEMDLPTETPFPTAGSGGKIVEVWTVAIMGMTATDWAEANGITLSV